MENRTCVDCDQTFHPIAARGRPRVRCFECSPYQPSRPRPPADRQCRWCGVDFATTSKVKVYCSSVCRETAKNNTPRFLPCDHCGEPTWSKVPAADGAVMHDACRTRCGTLGGYKNRGCRCEECRAANAEASRKMRESYRRRHGLSLSRQYRKGSEGRRHIVSAEVRLSIYKRDGWTCQLCMEPVDPELETNDLMAATLDHIECQSWVLFPDHSPENLRLAHRSCNSKRGAQPWPSETQRSRMTA